MDLYKMSLRPTSPTRPITPDCPRSRHYSKLGMWQKLQHFFGRDGPQHDMGSDNDISWSKLAEEKLHNKRGASSARPVGVGLPRQATFKRQNSEKRDRLCLVEPLPNERRAFSASRTAPNLLTKFRSNSVPSTSLPTRRSAPAIGNMCALDVSDRHSYDASPAEDPPPGDAEQPIEYDRQRPPRPASITSSTDSFDDQRDHFEDRAQLNRELDTKWILNLSMHFRDKSDREKFFVTYAETPTRWRRVTVSCDYRNAEAGSLEMDLKELQLQRDKSMQIYEAIRDSLLEIKFYDTVTNLKLETSDGRLHVHVTEDVNEIIPYPPISNLQHILSDSVYQPRQIRESELSFEAHLSGFVYKVMYKDMPYIKKEIPGPDTVDEFLYEVNALHSLQDSRYVIDLEAIITDDSGQLIKGLLINYAEQGAVVDLLYDQKGELAWELRERWARHAIQGLSDIHEEGYVQGDFTLSNIVVDRDDNARIIDINRRGCPVGWEPPEIARKIASNQRISMYIGEKSDLYQLGMTLWALAMDDDEPERHDPPLSTQMFPAEVPMWYQEVVRNCLSWRPRDRLRACDLLKMIPPEQFNTSQSSQSRRPSVRIKSEKQYIDPATAVERDDLERYRDWDEIHEARYSPESSREDYTFTWPQSSDYDRDYDTSSSRIERPRGRRRVSDQDLELQAQRRRERALVNGTDVDVDSNHHESIPIISISSDGAESHIVNAFDDESPIEVVPNDHVGNERTDGSPTMSPPLSSLQHHSDGLLFPSYSETSEDTPRNSSFQLFGTDNNFYPTDDVAQQELFSDNLAGLGSHVSPNEHHFDGTRFAMEESNRNYFSSPPPSMPFNDSGYSEPLAFGIVSEEELCTSEAPTAPSITSDVGNTEQEADEDSSATAASGPETQAMTTSVETDDMGEMSSTAAVPNNTSSYRDEEPLHNTIAVEDSSFRLSGTKPESGSESLSEMLATSDTEIEPRPSISNFLKDIDAHGFTSHVDDTSPIFAGGDLEGKDPSEIKMTSIDHVGIENSPSPEDSEECAAEDNAETINLEDVQTTVGAVESVSADIAESTVKEDAHSIVPNSASVEDKPRDVCPETGHPDKLEAPT